MSFSFQFFRLLIALIVVTYVFGFQISSSSKWVQKNLNRHIASSCLLMSNSISNNKKTFSVGIIGATGAVGEEILSVLERRSFPCSQLRLFASEKSTGKRVDSKVYGDLALEAFSFDEVSKLDVVLLAVGGDFALEWAGKYTILLSFNS